MPSDVLQSPGAFYAACFFLLLLLIILAIAYFSKPRPGNHQILRVLCSICAACAGVLFSGNAIFKLEGQWGELGKFSVVAVAGFALFMVVWFFFGKAIDIYDDKFHFAVGDNWMFEDVVHALVQRAGAVAHLKGFSDAERKAKLSSTELHTDNAVEAVRLLQACSREIPIRDYSVSQDGAKIVLSVL